MLGLGGHELLIILFVMVLLFGASRIPELGRSLGSGIREFKSGLRAVEEEENEEENKKIDSSEDV